MRTDKRYLYIICMIVVLEITNSLWARTISFAGYDWTVRNVQGGPGPNYFSDSVEEVWVDGNGYLHMEINYRNGKWNCSEVYLDGSLGYGTYAFVVDGRVDLLDKNIVLGLFTYETDTREIDIEYARWGNATNYPGQYVIQPGGTTGNVYRYHLDFSTGTDVTTNLFDWRADAISFRSYYGAYTPTPAALDMIASWVYFGDDNPPVGGELVHINLWLMSGLAPSDGQNVEIVIRDFKFDSDIIVPPVSPGLIDPGTLSATASSEFWDSWNPDMDFLPIHAVNGDGLAGETHTDIAFPNDCHWVSGDAANQWIVVDLAATYDLDSMKIWNLNRDYGFTGNGIENAIIRVSNTIPPGNPFDNAGNWTSVATPTLNEAPSSPDYDTPNTVNLVSVSARYVAITGDSFVGSNRIGLSEVQFFEVAPLGGDIDMDGFVNYKDFVQLGKNWLDSDCSDPIPCGRADIDGDNDMDIEDLSNLAGDWLQ